MTQNSSENCVEARITARIILSRTLLTAIGLVAWFWTQYLIGQRPIPLACIEDRLLVLLAPAHSFLIENPQWADALLAASTAIIDGLGVFILARGIFGSTVRPLLGLFMLFTARQVCQLLVALPLPEGIIWRDPGLPSLFVTYDVTGDQFFSGHTALAVYGCIELGRLGRRSFKAAGLMIVAIEMMTVLVLRAHWFLDVFAAAALAGCAALLAGRWAPACDRCLARLLGSGNMAERPWGRRSKSAGQRDE